MQAGCNVKFYEATERAIFPFFDAVVPVSHDIYNGLKSVPGLRKKLHLIHNGVDIMEVDNAKSAKEIAVWKSDGNFVVGYIGQLIARKRLEILLKAFSKLKIEKKETGNPW